MSELTAFGGRLKPDSQPCHKMKTQTVTDQPPPDLVQAVQRLKQWCPYRICWGAFKPSDPADTLTGADHDKRKFNAALRKGYVGFVL